MSTRERILTIRLIEKAKTNPAYAEALGIVVLDEQSDQLASPAADNE